MPVRSLQANRLHITLLGEFRLTWDDTAVTLDTPSHQLLLAYLALHPDQHHTRQHLAFTFWPDSTERQARTNLRKALYRLRHTLPESEALLHANRQTITWHGTGPFALDVNAFETAVARAQQADPPQRQTLLEQASHLYRGDLLPGHFQDWILVQREALRQRYLGCLQELVQLLEDARCYRAAITVARRLLQADPLHESGYRRLMRLQTLDGNRAGALRTYHTCATILQNELNVTPGAAIQSAYRRLLALEAAPRPPLPARIPLVGRQPVWRTLQSAWQQAQAQPTFVLLRGEAGIGKTRLAEELLDWAAQQGITTLRAACYAPATGLPYAPITTWLRSAGDALAPLPDKWQREVSRVLPDLLAARPDLPPPGPITESWQRQHLFTALAQAVAQLPPPLLLFIDDLQWCDRDTLKWLSFLLHFAPELRFLLLGTARTEEMAPVEALHTLCADARHENRLVEVDLGRLNAADTAVLAAQVVGNTVPNALPASLFTATEGVPLFVVELARAGFHTFNSTQTDVAPNRVLSAKTLPPRIRSVFETRLNALSATARDLADLAATIGRSFTFDLVKDAGEMDETTLVRALDELWQQRLVREQEADAYDFSHGLLREVAYGMLSAARRRLLHGRIVQALERERAAGLTVDDSQLGSHYAAIGRTRDAIACYRRAATAAQHIFAHEEALANLQQGLSLAAEINTNDGTLPALYEQQAEVLMLDGQYDAAHEALAVALAQTTNPLSQARLLHKRGNAWMAQHQRPAALAAFAAALNHLGPPSDPPDIRQQRLWLDVQLARGNAFYFNARLKELAALIPQLDAIVTAIGTVAQQRSCLELHNMLTISQKRYRLDADDVAMRRRISDLADQTGDPHVIAAARFSLGFHHLWAGLVDQAITHLSAALVEATEIGNRYVQDQCLAYLSLAYRAQGDEAQVEATLARHRPITAQVGNPLYGGVLAGNEAWLAYRAEDWPTAVSRGKAALAAWGELPYPFLWVALWPLLGTAVIQQRPTDGVAYARRMLVPPQQTLPAEITAVLQQAIAAWDKDDTVVAQRCLATAVARAQAGHIF